jgi:hypothetical protein
MTVRRFEALLITAAIGAVIASMGTVYLLGSGEVQLMSTIDTPQKVLPEGATIHGHDTDKYITVGPHATHMDCALKICPKLQANLACVKRTASATFNEENRFIGYGWIGLYQDMDAAAATVGWDSWVSGCDMPVEGLWKEGQPKWDGGSPERCAYATFHMTENDVVKDAKPTYGGGISSAPCWEKRPCICEYGAYFTKEYFDATDAMMAEKDGWSAWRKENRSTIASVMLFLCVVTQIACIGILGLILKYKQALIPEDLEAGKKAESEEKKAPEEPQSPRLIEAAKEIPQPEDGADEKPDGALPVSEAALPADAAENDAEQGAPSEKESVAQEEVAAQGGDDASPKDAGISLPEGAGQAVPPTSLATPVALDELVLSSQAVLGEAPPPRRGFFGCFQEPCCYQSTESSADQVQLKATGSDRAFFY